MPTLELKPVRKKQKLIPLLDAIGSLLFLPNLIRRRTLKAEDLRLAKRILWVNVGGLGDLVLATPALASLRNCFPDTHITLLAKPETKPLMERCPWVDELILTASIPWSRRTGKYHPKRYLSSEFLGLIRTLRKRRFDLVIDAHMDIRNNLLLFLTGAQRRLGFDYGGGRYFLTDLVVPNLMRSHHADLAVQLVGYLGGKSVLDQPTLHIAEEHRRAANDFWLRNGLDRGDLVVGVHPGAGYPVRYWGLNKFARVADALSERFPVRFLCFSQPDGYGSDIPIQAQHIKITPDLGLLMALLEKCDLLLCNDGGPMHVAAGVGTPVVAVFGPTEPKWWGPYGPGHSVVILEDFPCRPCGDLCKFDRPYCLTELSVPRVIAALEERLASLLAMPRG